MIDNEGIAPSRSKQTRTSRILRDRMIQHHVIKFILAQLFHRILSERPHSL